MSHATAELIRILKRLRLSGILATLPHRLAYVDEAGLTPLEFLQLILQDEIERRDNKNLNDRLKQAGFAEEQTIENFNWDAAITFNRNTIRDLLNLTFLDRAEDVILLGPVGVGKTHLATAIGHAACRAGKRVLSLRSDTLLKQLHQSRADNSTEKTIRSLLTPDLLIIDDFGLKRLNAQQSSDFYEIIIERHKRSSTIITSNRTIDEWIPLFDDPILAQSALDRLAHNAYQIPIEGKSYRTYQRPGQSGNPPGTPGQTPTKKRKTRTATG